MNVTNLEEYTKALLALQRQGRLEEALRSVTDFAVNLTERESTFGRLFGSEELDRVTSKLGTLASGFETYRMRPRAGVVVIATALYTRGGHTGSMSDLLGADQSSPTTVLLTNVGHDLHVGELAGLLPDNVEIEIAPGTGLAPRMRWVQNRLKSLRPERTYLFQHPYDAVAVAAAQPALIGDAYFYHHADHGFTLGLYAPESVHIDPTPKIFHQCRSELGLSRNVYWPLTAPEHIAVSRRRGGPRLAGLVTCSSGGMEKFESVALLDRVPYQISYEDAVTTILRTTGGRHVHIGPLSEQMLDKISQAMDAAGVSASNFVHITETPDLPSALQREGVDVYMGSFPRGGGRALIAAMSVGLPLVLHANYRGWHMSDVGEAYPGVLQWKNLAELKAVLASVTGSVLADQRKRSREHYEAWHRPELFREAVLATLDGQSPRIPSAQLARANTVQTYLDEQQRTEELVDTGDTLSLLLQRNEGWKTLGGPQIGQTLVENHMYSGLIDDRKGIFLHAGPEGRMSLTCVAPGDARAIAGIRATIEFADSRSAALEFAVAAVRGDDDPDLLKVAAWLSTAGPNSKHPEFILLSPWQEYRGGDPEVFRSEWHQRRPLISVVLAVRMAGSNPNNEYAMLSFRDIEWRAAPTKLQATSTAKEELKN